MRWPGWGALSIRLRLGAALAIALAPVLMLGVAQSIISFRADAAVRESNLLAAADRSAILARARVENAVILLEALSPEAVGLSCAPRLRALLDRAPQYANLIQFDYGARPACAAGTVRPDAARAQWFVRLRDGEPMAVYSAAPGIYAPQATVIAAIRRQAPDGAFAGATAAAIRLEALKPDLTDRNLPRGTEVALVDGQGRFLITSAKGAFAPPPEALGRDAVFYRARDASGDPRVFATSPMLGDDIRVVLSAPSPGLFSWARLNLLSTVLLPLVAFTAALLAVWVVTEQVIVRWLHYLQRIAGIYGKGRLTVKPLRAHWAPPEFRALAATLQDMAVAIDARDHSLRDSLAGKDALMREIHHRVKNNLQVISSLLSMQQRALTDPAARSAISDTRQRISAMALIYRALYQGEDLKHVDLKPFLEELTAQILAADGLAGVRTELEADTLIIDPDKLAPIALFAVEAVSNAQKHALARAGGLLRVRFELGDQEGALEISDEGTGQAPVLGVAGVGRTLMNAFARQLHGKADVFANDAGGVTARLVFPLPGSGSGKPLRRPPESRNQAAA